MRDAVDRLAALAARGVRVEATSEGRLRPRGGSLSAAERLALSVDRPAVFAALGARREPASVSAGELHFMTVRDLRHQPVASTVFAETLQPYARTAEGKEMHRFAWTWSRPGYARLRRQGVPVFVGGELEAMAVAAQQERCRPEALRDWLERKLERPDWRCVGEALSGARDRSLGELTFGQLAWELDVRLLEVVAETREQ